MATSVPVTAAVALPLVALAIAKVAAATAAAVTVTAAVETLVTRVLHWELCFQLVHLDRETAINECAFECFAAHDDYSDCEEDDVLGEAIDDSDVMMECDDGMMIALLGFVLSAFPQPPTKSWKRSGNQKKNAQRSGV